MNSNKGRQATEKQGKKHRQGIVQKDDCRALQVDALSDEPIDYHILPVSGNVQSVSP